MKVHGSLIQVGAVIQQGPSNQFLETTCFHDPLSKGSLPALLVAMYFRPKGSPTSPKSNSCNIPSLPQTWHLSGGLQRTWIFQILLHVPSVCRRTVKTSCRKGPPKGRVPILNGCVEIDGPQNCDFPLFPLCICSKKRTNSNWCFLKAVGLLLVFPKYPKCQPNTLRNIKMFSRGSSWAWSLPFPSWASRPWLRRLESGTRRERPKATKGYFFQISDPGGWFPFGCPLFLNKNMCSNLEQTH